LKAYVEGYGRDTWRPDMSHDVGPYVSAVYWQTSEMAVFSRPYITFY